MLVVLCQVGGIRLAGAQAVLPNFPDTNGPVYSTAVSGTTLYVGGAFTRINPVHTGGLPIDAVTAMQDPGFPVVLGTVSAAVADGAGGWYIGGAFTSVGSVTRQNLARVLQDHSVSSWDPAPNGSVSALATDGSTLYVGGEFTSIGGVPRNSIAAIGVATGTVTSWNPSVQGKVLTIKVNGTAIHAGGSVSNALYAGYVSTLDAATGVTGSANLTDGEVRTVSVSGSTLYVGGAFSGFLTPRHAAAFDATTAAVDMDFPQVQGEVFAVAPDEQGGWYIGGSFSSVGQTPRNNLAHVLADHSLADWQPDPNGPVLALATIGSEIYIGGTFTSVGGQSRNDIASIDAVTGLATAWDPGPNGPVSALATDGSAVYAAGAFGSIGGHSRNGIAALDPSTGQATDWNPNPDQSVTCLAASGGVVYAAGSFTTIGGATRVNIAALDPSTGQATSWSPPPLSIQPTCHEECIPCGGDGCCGSYWVCDPPPATVVTALAVTGSTVYIGGSFELVGDAFRPNLAALDIGSGNVTSWAPGPAVVRCLAAGAGGIYAAWGSYVGGQPTDVVVALDPVTGVPTSWHPALKGAVGALAVKGSTVLVCGTFYTPDATRGNVAAVDLVSGHVNGWSPNANGAVSALVVDGAVVYAGGEFTSIGGGARNRIAALDLTTAQATSWDPGLAGSAPAGGTTSVNALATDGTSVYAGGSFSSVGGEPRLGVVALDAATGQATSWAPEAVNGVRALAVSGSFVYAGGDPGPYCGLKRQHLAAIDVVTAQVSPWEPDPNDIVRVVAVEGSTLYAGGDFTAVSGESRSHIAAFDVLNGSITSWDPGADGIVQALAVGETVVYAGGLFTSAGGQPRHWLAALDRSTALATDFDPSPQDPSPFYPTLGITTLVLNGFTLWVGGSFTSTHGSYPGGLPNVVGLDSESGNVTVDYDFTFGCCSPVTALTVSGALVYMATTGGMHTGSIYGVISGYNPQISGPVMAVVEKDGIVYVGGDFSFVRSTVRHGIAALDWSEAPTAWYPAMQPNARVSSITLSGNRFYLGGAFTSTQGARHNLAAVPLTITGISAPEDESPGVASLGPCQPNPSPGSSDIWFRTAKSARVTLKIFDVAGREVRTLADRAFERGPHVVPWDGRDRAGRDVASGVYFCVLRTDEYARKMKIAVLH